MAAGPPQSNMPPPQPVAKKPVGGRVVVIIMALALTAVIVLSALMSLARVSTPPSQRIDATPADQRAGKDIGDDTARTANLIRQNEAKIARALDLAARLKAQLPECNAKLRQKLNGAYYTLHSNNAEYPDANLACDPDDTWRVIPPATSVVVETPTETEAQRTAERRASPNGELTPRERLRLRRQAAFESDSIPVHFADNTGSGSSTSTTASNVALGLPSATTGASAPQVATNTQQSQPAPASQPNGGAQDVPLGVELSHYAGPRWVLMQGSYLEGFLVNRLVGDMTGPVKVQISTPKYDNSGQHLLIPAGTILLGEAQRLGAPGESRLAMIFHRAIMPDGFSMLLKPDSPGLDQEGAIGLTGKLNKHVWSKIATAVMIGAIEGASNFADAGSGGVVVIQGGASQQAGTQAMQIFQSALNRPNSIEVAQGSPMRIPLMWDFPVPEVSGHRVQQTVP